MTSTGTVYVWRGADRRGQARNGVMALPAADLPARVEAWFGQRWRWLVVLRDGAEVARIGRDDRTRRRFWYAETGEANQEVPPPAAADGADR